jgi:hypothetical protein
MWRSAGRQLKNLRLGRQQCRDRVVVVVVAVFAATDDAGLGSGAFPSPEHPAGAYTELCSDTDAFGQTAGHLPQRTHRRAAVVGAVVVGEHVAIAPGLQFLDAVGRRLSVFSPSAGDLSAGVPFRLISRWILAPIRPRERSRQFDS